MRITMSTPTRTLACTLAGALMCVAGLFASGVGMAAEHGPGKTAGLAHFDVYADGDTLHLLTGYRSADVPGVALWHRRSTDGGSNWSAPVRVNGEGRNLFSPHPGENPQIAARGEHVLAVWNEHEASRGKPGPLASAVSHDGGKTWQPAGNPASDGTQTYHALVELGASSSDFHAVWLHGRGKDGAKQALHHAASADGKTWRAQARVDESTCDCCWNRVVADGNRVGVLYRGGAPRDMKFAASLDGQWSAGVPVGGFIWPFEGCPHVGGALAAAPGFKALHALVWTGMEGKAGLYYLSSDDAGARWSAPARLGGDEATHADLALASNGRLTAVWDTKSEVQRAHSRDGGKTWSEPESVSNKDASARHPRVFWTRHGVATLWLERKESTNTLWCNGTELTLPAG